MKPAWQSRFAWVAFALALILYPALLWHYIRATAPVFDEGEHIAAGYRYWQCGDYGINPEHPPLAKLIAAAPIRNWQVDGPAWPCGSRITSNTELIGAGYRLINGRDSDEMLRACRQSLLVFPILLIVVLFFAARAWFGPLAAGIAVLLAVFEPNLTAHAPLVTTDMALTATTLLTLFAAWGYWRKPSVLRLLALGCAMGLALASKHSAVLVPFVVLLAFSLSGPLRGLWRLSLAWLAACALALVVLWSTYQFRFDALPGGHGPAFDMPAAIQSAGLKGTPSGWLIASAARHRLVPESYLAGLLWVKANSTRETYFFGRQLQEGVWYYFPAAIAIKTPLALLALVLVGLASPGVWRLRRGSMVWALAPVAGFLGAAMLTGMNLGIRHILPVYPFLILVAAAGAAHWAGRYRWAALACAALIVSQAVSYARSYPNEIAYANEAWGGPENLHRYLGDSNVDWGQSLYLVRDYVKQHGIHDCWIAWFGMRKPQLVGIPCRALAGPMFLEAWDWELPPVLPDRFDGTLLISSTLTNLRLFPYGTFLDRRPDHVIGAGVFVFHGGFDLPEIAAERRAARGWWYMNHAQPERAIEEFQAAVEHVHAQRLVRSLYAWALQSAGRPEDVQRQSRLADAIP
jgi:hypothetical protein